MTSIAQNLIKSNNFVQPTFFFFHFYLGSLQYTWKSVLLAGIWEWIDECATRQMTDFFPIYTQHCSSKAISPYPESLYGYEETWEKETIITFSEDKENHANINPSSH